jgi:hypothetical protein
MLHTVGDSHSHFGWYKIPGIKIHWVGPLLCHSFGQQKLGRINLKKLGVAEEDSICFCLGEIDCRCHIHKHISETTDYRIIVKELVKNYMLAIHENEKLYNNIKIYVYSVTPPAHKSPSYENPQYPFLGSDEERREYTQYFNHCLEKICKKYNYIFLNVADKYADNDGFLNPKYSDGVVHINDPVFILECIDNKYVD